MFIRSKIKLIINELINNQTNWERVCMPKLIPHKILRHHTESVSIEYYFSNAYNKFLIYKLICYGEKIELNYFEKQKLQKTINNIQKIKDKQKQKEALNNINFKGNQNV